MTSLDFSKEIKDTKAQLKELAKEIKALEEKIENCADERKEANLREDKRDAKARQTRLEEILKGLYTTVEAQILHSQEKEEGRELARIVDVESSVVVCRTLLESQVKHYIQDHVKYVNNTKAPKCTHVLNSKTSVSDALDHMQSCPGQLETWKVFKSNSKLYTSAPGKAVYSSLSESVHTAYVKENQVHIPEFLEPIPKRFLLRLFKVLQYRVQVVDREGNLRDPVPDELETPQSSPEIDKKKNKRSQSESSNDTSDNKTSKKKKSKKNKA